MAATLVVAAARTASGNSGPLVVGYSPLNIEIETTAVSGTSPSMTVAVQWSVDGVNFAPVDGTPDQFAAITAAGNVLRQVSVKGPYMQIVWTITGTGPSFTFSVSAA
ncbi:hypothetical protein [Streptomyces roseochromogenus]|uniref:Uncharacterized protein n=1 Tax=Streptomyces roseochromogenus subsp. oscitans DS 12.976 TaxID=1352936 RepID=V6JXH0_STRRC|nr:hypothetical protein [Streptomyces roseochromogenus]EST24383.1 hypothetical protein M878_30690 [Streptomyces roseochromogenus subsp. oscitans DS 12.976]